MPSGPAFLFDLDGTLVDSVYQHVLAWRVALESVGIELSVWRIHRRIGMRRRLIRQRAVPRDRPRAEARAGGPDPARAHRSLRPPGLTGASPAGRTRAARLPDEGGRPVGDRHQRANGERQAQPRYAGHSRRRADRDPRPGGARQARSRLVPRGRRAAGGPDRRVGGGRGQRVGPARGAPAPPRARRGDSCRVVTERKSSSARGHTACTRIPPTF